jgi:hypothetical protein
MLKRRLSICVQVLLKISLAYLATCKTVVMAIYDAVERVINTIDAVVCCLTDTIRIIVVTPLHITHQAASYLEGVLKDTLEKVFRPQGRSSALHGATTSTTTIDHTVLMINDESMMNFGILHNDQDFSEIWWLYLDFYSSHRLVVLQCCLPDDVRFIFGSTRGKRDADRSLI